MKLGLGFLAAVGALLSLQPTAARQERRAAPMSRKPKNKPRPNQPKPRDVRKGKAHRIKGLRP